MSTSCGQNCCVPPNRAALGVGVAFAVLLMAGSAMAQQTPPPPLPGPASPVQRILPPAAVPTKPGLEIAPARAVNLADPNMTANITSASLDGATRYPADTFAAALASLHGEVKVLRIDEVRRQILDRYRNDGYVLTTVTATADPQGRLRFTVVEGRIAEVKLDGDIGPAGTQVLRFLNRLTEITPIDSDTLERYLLLAQDVPGVTLRAVLQPSTQEPGALTLIAQVSRRAVSGLLTADNRGAPFTGPEAALALISLNSVTEYGEKTEVSLFRSLNDTQLFGQVATEAFVGSSGLKVRLYAGSGTADPSGQLRATGYHGVTTVGGISATYPLIRTRKQSLNIGAYFDVLESHIDTGLTPSQQASRENLRVLRFGADYARQDTWLGANRSAVNSVSVRLSQGLPFIGASPEHDLKAGRLNERVDFVKVNADLTRTQTLFLIGEASSVALQTTIAGQYSPNILPSAEKFFLGGTRWNRGYYSGEVSGDNALTTAVELQYNTTFDADIFGKAFDFDTQLYAFYDWGQSFENQKTDASRRLQSFGIGTRISISRTTELNLEGVTRTVRRPQGAASTTVADKAQAVYWRVLTRF